MSCWNGGLAGMQLILMLVALGGLDLGASRVGILLVPESIII